MLDKESVTFAGGALDRAAHLRSDSAELLKHPDARAMVLWLGKPLINLDGPHIAWLSVDAPILNESDVEPIFIGLQEGSPRFAYDISAWMAEDADDEAMARFLDDSRNQHPDLPENLQFIELRAVMSELSHDDAGDACTAKGIFEWHKIHKFCANCGATSVVAQAGWQRNCPNCDRSHFPRTDPVVIMLVTDGNDVLLGRSPAWPEGMYSLLAGYMEPGEGIEEAVRREVFEETGVRCGEVEYLTSQPWPFPASLMIGCQTQALGRELTLDPVEIEDARWVSREYVADAMLGNNPTLKPSRQGSIARFLLDAWVADRLDG